MFDLIVNVVGQAVELNDQPRLDARGVGCVRRDWMLAAKLRADAAIAQRLPKDPFGAALLAPQ